MEGEHPNFNFGGLLGSIKCNWPILKNMTGLLAAAHGYITKLPAIKTCLRHFSCVLQQVDLDTFQKGAECASALLPSPGGA